jgi:tetratricopeptide (TPR) repeat protein
MRMRQACLVLVAMLSIPSSAMAESTRHRLVAKAPAEAEANDPALRLARQKLAAADALFQAGNMLGAFRGYDAVVHDPAFASLPIRERRGALSHAGFAALRSDKSATARDLYRQATGLASDDPDDWYRLMFLEFGLGEPDRARDAMRHFVETWPELLPNIDSSAIPQLVYGPDSESEARYELMQALFDANWNDPSAADGVWYQLAIAQVQRGRMDDAQRTVRRIDHAGSIIRLRADKRFDAIVDPRADAFDPALSARRQLERLRQAADAAPDEIDPIVQLGYAMSVLGMFGEMVGLADEAIERIVNAPAGKPPFTDMHNQVWLMNLRSDALLALGKREEALAELKRARDLDENGGANVSQALNLGELYCRLQRPREALREITRVGSTSGYGRMVQAAMEHCADVELGDSKGALAALDYLRKHEQDAPLQLLDALLLESRMDEAASLVEKLLADGYRRGDILDWMQDTRSTPPLPGDVAQVENRKALIARPDVAAALERVGRIEHYDLYE